MRAIENQEADLDAEQMDEKATTSTTLSEQIDKKGLREALGATSSSSGQANNGDTDQIPTARRPRKSSNLLQQLRHQ